MVAGFAVQVLQRQAFRRQVAQTMVTSAIIQKAYAYKTIFDQVVAPFMVASAMHMSAMAKLYEILQTVKATVITESSPQLREESEPESEPEHEIEPEESATEEIETQLSRGFCLNISELGDLLISHEGDVVFDSGKLIEKSLRITAPSQVILNDTKATDIEVEAGGCSSHRENQNIS
jgi:hypothetical protein